MPRAPATIVVLEENAAAQELIDQTLRTSGDRVLISNNPMEALGLSSRVRIDLLIGDFALLERSGPNVVEKLCSVAQVLYTNVPRGSTARPRRQRPRFGQPLSLGGAQGGRRGRT
jgi:CheY-like chemotaxis protein